MVLVDTTVWADWFNGRDTPEVRRLEQALDQEDVGLTPWFSRRYSRVSGRNRGSSVPAPC